MNKNNSERNKKLEAVKNAMLQIEKQYGKGSIMRLGSQAKVRVPVISTGSLGLDLALGVGGLPKGRIVEIYGPEASGKTTVVLHTIAEAQKKGGTAAFIDVEHALDPNWAEKIGVNLNDLLISQPDTGEQALEIAETLVRSGGVDLIAVDSVAALVPRAEIEGEMGDAMIGVQARLMSQAMRKLAGAISKSKTVMIFTNQIRMRIGVMFGNPETTSGGQALKFYASIRMDVRKIGKLEENGQIIGSRHRVRVTKNKVAPPFRQAEFDIMSTNGISQVGEVLDLALEDRIIERSGSFYKFEKQILGQGREAVKKYLEDKPKILEKLKKTVIEKVSQKESE